MGNKVSKHCIWNDIDIWMATVGKAISNERKKQGVSELSENEIVMILRKFTNYLVMLKVELKKAVNVIRQCVEFCKVSKKYADELIFTIYVHQPSTFEVLKNKALALKHKRSKEFVKTSLTKDSLISTGIKLSISYMNDIKIFKNVLLLNRTISEALKPVIYKRLLLSIQLPLTDTQRLNIWHSILQCVILLI